MGIGAIVVAWFGRDWLLTKFLKQTPPELLLPSLALIPFMLLQFYPSPASAQAEERFPRVQHPAGGAEPAEASSVSRSR
jgi:hypothetical protein